MYVTVQPWKPAAWKLTTCPWGEELSETDTTSDSVVCDTTLKKSEPDYVTKAIFEFMRTKRDCHKECNLKTFQNQKFILQMRSESQAFYCIPVQTVSEHFVVWPPPIQNTSTSDRCSFVSSEPLWGCAITTMHCGALRGVHLTRFQYTQWATQKETHTHSLELQLSATHLLSTPQRPVAMALLFNTHTHTKKFNILLSFSPFPRRREGLISAVRPLFHHGYLLMAY